MTFNIWIWGKQIHLPEVVKAIHLVKPTWVGSKRSRVGRLPKIVLELGWSCLDKGQQVVPLNF